jgi:hypothetical protein
MITVPEATPEIVPEEEPIVARYGEPELQVPPVESSVRVMF